MDSLCAGANLRSMTPRNFGSDAIAIFLPGLQAQAENFKQTQR
jgi:hypothetical protein